MARTKKRRSAVDEVLGGASPVARKIRAQKEAARLARLEDGVSEGAGESPQSEASAPEVASPPIEAKPAVAPVAQPEPDAPPLRTKTVVARAVGEGRNSAQAKRRAAAGRPAKRKPAKRIPISGSEGDVWEGVCRTLSGCVGAKVTFAAASRAIWAMIAEIEDDLEAGEGPQLDKPAHADAVANAEFEMALQAYIHEVLVKASKKR